MYELILVHLAVCPCSKVRDMCMSSSWSIWQSVHVNNIFCQLLNREMLSMLITFFVSFLTERCFVSNSGLLVAHHELNCELHCTPVYVNVIFMVEKVLNIK